MRPHGQRSVDFATVVGHNVLYITDILEPPFDFERSDARVEQLADMRRKVQVAHRQQVFPGNIGTSPAVGQVVSQAARLAARPAVAAAVGHRPREETAAAVTDTDRPVDETFHLGRGRSADVPYFAERKRPFEDHPGEPALAQETRLGRCHIAHLRRSMQLDRQVHAPQRHVLHDQRIDPGRDQFAGLPPGGLQLVVVDQRVERGMHPHSVTMGIFHHTGDLAGAVARRITGSELRPADIHGIGTVVHGGDGRLKIFGGSE